jgi:hypothetical protein
MRNDTRRRPVVDVKRTDTQCPFYLFALLRVASDSRDHIATVNSR